MTRKAVGWTEGGNCSSQSAIMGRDARMAAGGMVGAQEGSEGRRWSRSGGRGREGIRCSRRKPEWLHTGQAGRQEWGSMVPQ